MFRLNGFSVSFFALILFVSISSVSARQFQNAGKNNNEIDVAENFVFAEDKTNVLSSLVPGSEEYYFYHALYFQNKGQLKNSARMLYEWEHNKDNSGLRSERFINLKNRQALLMYDKDPSETIEYLTKKLGLRYNHFKKSGVKQRNYSSSLDQDTISTDQISKKILSKRNATLSDFTDEGLYQLDSSKFDIQQVRELLKRVNTPDFPNLVQLIIRELKDKRSQGFGTYLIHEKLTLAQMDSLIKSVKGLTSNNDFVAAYMQRIMPKEVIDEKDPATKIKKLKKVWKFVVTLPDIHNSVKLHLLHDILKSEQKVGNYNKKLFVEYLKIPRMSVFAKQSHLSSRSKKMAMFNSSIAIQSGFNRIDNDNQLVKDYLEQFLAQANSYGEFLPYLEENFLKNVFAEIKILNGIGDKKKWFAQLPASKYEEINERVELRILPQNKVSYKSNDSVELNLALKNIDTLVANVYEINALNYYKKFSKPVAVSINLEGLEANNQSVLKFDKPSHIRHNYTLALPQTAKSGIYVIDLVGNGINSRAIISKGGLNFTQREGVSGHLFRVYDENNKLIKDSSIWLDGHNYTSDENGRIIIPFTKKALMQDIVISANGISSLHKFFHDHERYQLRAAVLYNKEALIRSNPTEIAISPQLSLNGRPVDASILKNLSVEISLEKLGDNSSEIVEKKVYSDLKFNNGKDIKIPFSIIQGISVAKLGIKVSASVENISLNKTEQLNYTTGEAINYDSYISKIGDAYLRKVGDEYLIETIGRNGESLADHSVHLEFTNENFTKTIRANLQSDVNGKINLGELKDIKQIKVSDSTGINRKWSLEKQVANIPDFITAKVGERLVFPVNKNKFITLFELVDEHYFKDLSKKISITDGYAAINGLNVGKYILRNGATKVSITVEDGIADNGFLLSKEQYLQYKPYKPLLIAEVNENGLFSKDLVIKTENFTKDTRIHILGTRFFNEDLSNLYNLNPYPSNGGAAVHDAMAKYSSGRRLSDELRYIMERKLADKYPGNMLKRPSLLIKPLEFGKTTTKEKSFKGGGKWEDDALQESMLFGRAPSEAMDGKFMSDLMPHDYNFLAGKSLVLLNLIPDENGEVRIDLAKLNGNQHIAVIATGGSDIAYAYYDREETDPAYKDIRQKKLFATNDHYRQENSIQVFNDLKTFKADNKGITDYEIYSSVADVYALYKAINGDNGLDKFRFLLQWQDLSEAEKQHKYSRYASHELNFYLYQRDKDFFDSKIKPVISNKLKKDFIDDWLLHNDLSKYVVESEYSRLNVIEKALLAKRVKWQKDAVLSDLTDAINSKEADLYKQDMLFDIALTGGVDASQDTIVSGDAMDEIVEEEFDSKRKSMPRMRAMAAPPKLMKQNFIQPQVLAESSDKDFEARKRHEIEQFYTAPDKTKSWVEQRYYGVLPNELNFNYIELSKFWIDYVKSNKDKVLSKNLAFPTNNLTEMLFALAVLDLPINEAKSSNGISKQGKGVVFARLQYKENNPEQNDSILLGQNIFPKDQRYKYINNIKQENFLEDGFVKGKIYGMQTVITNTTSLQDTQELFIQIPQGAIPVANGFYTKSIKVRLDPFATQTIENFFYFPKSGNFSLYPAHAFDRVGLVSFAKTKNLTVNENAVIADKDSWDYISQNGTEEQQIEFIKKNNVKRIDLNKIAYKYKNKQFFLKLLKVLKDKHHYDSTFWSYSVKHNIPEEIANYLHVGGFAQKCGDYLNSSLIKIHAESDGSYLHKEFWPLINKRAFQFGNKRYIENKDLLDQYNSLMQLLSYKGEISDYDSLVISYYLLLQDRLADAEKWFAKVDKKKVFQKMPYDYMAAYLSFYKADVKHAYSIAERYLDYPVEHWRDNFTDIINQAKQINQTEVRQAYSVDSLKDRERQMFSFASDDSAIDIMTGGESVQVRMQNLQKCKLNFYTMDLEVLFSRKPFAMQLSDQFALIKPNVTLDVYNDVKKDMIEVAIPDQLKGQSLLVEAVGGGAIDSVSYYPNTLITHINDKYGIARIASTKDNKALSSVYIKVYARFKNGEIKFYKDGYTDLRGMFDYLSQNDDDLELIERFSILILSEDNGALIKEVDPPKI